METRIRTNTIPILIFVAGILIFPLSMLELLLPDSMRAEIYNGLGIFNIILLAVSIVFLMIACVHMKQNRKNVLFWIGFILNIIYLAIRIVLPLIYVIVMSDFN